MHLQMALEDHAFEAFVDRMIVPGDVGEEGEDDFLVEALELQSMQKWWNTVYEQSNVLNIVLSPRNECHDFFLLGEVNRSHTLGRKINSRTCHMDLAITHRKSLGRKLLHHGRESENGVGP